MSKTKFPSPTDVDPSLVIVKDVGQISLTLQKYGVAVVPIPVVKEEMEKAFKETMFYSTANSIFTEEHQVDEPTLDEFYNPASFKKRKAGDDTQGMIHQYGTPLHTLIQSNPVVRSIMKTLYGDEIHYLPNRLRVSRKFKNNDNSLHIEAHELFKEVDGEIQLIPGHVATLVGLTGIRRFVFWDMNEADLKPLKDYHDKYGSEFTSIKPEYMHTHFPGRRRMVNIDCNDTPHMILWQESNPHEIASSPSISLYISPVSNFNNTIISNVTSYQPDEFIGLSYHQSNLLALCYNMGGFEWPSGKKLYQFCHHRAYKHFIPKIKNHFTVKNKFKQKLPNNGFINQHSHTYKMKLNSRGIVLPDIAFNSNTPPFYNDISSLPDFILKDYGFIHTLNYKNNIDITKQSFH